MSTSVHEIIGVFASIVVLAGLAVAITNGELTARIITSAGDTFVNSIRAATLQPR